MGMEADRIKEIVEHNKKIHIFKEELEALCKKHMLSLYVEDGCIDIIDYIEGDIIQSEFGDNTKEIRRLRGD